MKIGQISNVKMYYLYSECKGVYTLEGKNLLENQ